MQRMIRISAIRDRVAALRLTMKAVCEEAGVPDSTISRWLSGEGGARLEKYEDFCGKLETALTDIEARELQRLKAVQA